MFLSSAEGDVRELLELPQGCQGTFRGSGGKVVFLSRHCSGKGPQLAWRGEPPGFSRVAVGFLTRYDGDLRDPLVGPQGGSVSTRVTRGPSVFLCSRCRGQGPHLQLRPEPLGSSPGPTLIQGVPLGHPLGSQGLIYCGAIHVHSPLEPKKQCRLPVGLTIGIVGFHQRRHRAVTAAILFSFDPRSYRRVSAGESGVSGVHWDIGGLL